MSKKKSGSRHTRNTSNRGRTMALILDAGKVVVNFEFEMVCQRFMQATGLSQQTVLAFVEIQRQLGYDRGLISTADLLIELNQQIELKGGRTLSLDEFRQAWNASFREDQEMAALLERLSKRVPLYLLSNTNEEHWRHLDSQYRISRHFRSCILSHEVGRTKPDKAIYLEALRRCGLSPQDCVFFDDLKENVLGARKAGIRARLFTGMPKFLRDLRALGIEL